MIKFIGSRNLFDVIPFQILSLSQLQILVLSGNKLNSIPQAFNSLFFLRVIDLANNNFVEIPKLIQCFKKLRILSFSHNAISQIPEDFTFPENLTFLDLSYNMLKSIKLNLSQLNCLSLDYNKLTSFCPDNLTKCRFISLNCNPFEKSLISMIPSFMKLDELKELEYIGNNNNQKVPLLKFNITDDYYIDIPKTFEIGYSSTIGLRPGMEDSLLIQSFGEKGNIFAILDGHSGNTTSTTAVKCILHEMIKIVNIIDSLNISEKLSELVYNVNNVLKEFHVKDGSTLALAYIFKGKCYVLGVGDSRIVRVKKNEYSRVTIDNKPLNKSEFRRLQDNGLDVNSEGRINRKLAVSNTIGDFWVGDGLFVNPYVSTFDIDEDDIGLIIACDGLWDVITDETASEIVRNSKTSSDASSTLKNFAFSLQSKDNISVLVVKFNPKEDRTGFYYKNEVEILPEHVNNEEPDDLFPITQQRSRRRR